MHSIVGYLLLCMLVCLPIFGASASNYGLLPALAAVQAGYNSVQFVHGGINVWAGPTSSYLLLWYSQTPSVCPVMLGL